MKRPVQSHDAIASASLLALTHFQAKLVGTCSYAYSSHQAHVVEHIGDDVHIGPHTGREMKLSHDTSSKTVQGHHDRCLTWDHHSDLFIKFICHHLVHKQHGFLSWAIQIAPTVLFSVN